MNKLKVIFLLMALLVACSTSNKDESNGERIPVDTPFFNALTQLSFKEYDQFLEDKQSAIVYFGWVINCGDSLNFQENYFEQLLEEHSYLKDNIIVINLDNEAPDALIQRELREPLIEKYDVGFSPTLLQVVEGKIVNKVEWTLKESDSLTAIPKDILDNFFSNTGYLR